MLLQVAGGWRGGSDATNATRRSVATSAGAHTVSDAARGRRGNLPGTVPGTVPDCLVPGTTTVRWPGYGVLQCRRGTGYDLPHRIPSGTSLYVTGNPYHINPALQIRGTKYQIILNNTDEFRYLEGLLTVQPAEPVPEDPRSKLQSGAV